MKLPDKSNTTFGKVDDCPMCGTQPVKQAPYDTSRWLVGAGVFLMPALGMICRGNLLAATYEHTTSFAKLGRNRLRLIDDRLKLFENYLSRAFDECVRIEHGSDNISTCGSGGCLDHAHIQEFPVGGAVAGVLYSRLDWQQLDRYEDLSELQGEPYIYLGWLGMHFVVPNPDLPSQWGRKIVAECRGIDDWDWALRNDESDLVRTFLQFNRPLQPRTLC